MYKVVSGDTFISIASHFGITVDALRAANPEVQEHFLSIGQALVIPAQSGTPAAAPPSPTPVGVQTGPVQCFLQATGGEWCIVLVANPGPDPVEGVLVRFSLYTAVTQDPSFSREAALSVNRLLPGERAPAAMYIAPSEREGEITRAEVISAIRSGETDPTVPVTVISQTTHPLDGGLNVEFDIRISTSASVPAKRMEAVVTLLDSAGKPVGFRLMRAEGEWQPGSSAHFTLRVYALGGTPEKHELMVRAFP
jgi:murein DD-endopeptidase MepM/ murein hydrolase activator NlpD